MSCEPLIDVIELSNAAMESVPQLVLLVSPLAKIIHVPPPRTGTLRTAGSLA